MNRKEQIAQLESEWENSPRWKGVSRFYSAEDVVKLRGTVQIEYTLARQGAEKMWRLVNQEEPLCGLGALTGNQARSAGSAGRATVSGKRQAGAASGWTDAWASSAARSGWRARGSNRRAGATALSSTSDRSAVSISRWSWRSSARESRSAGVKARSTTAAARCSRIIR